MTRDQFKTLFLTALEEAARIAEQQHNIQLSRNFEIEFYGSGYSGKILDVDTALDALYLGEDKFLKLVDVAIKGVNTATTRVFVRVSGYPHVSTFEETGDATTTGAFKQLIAGQLQRLPD